MTISQLLDMLESKYSPLTEAKVKVFYNDGKGNKRTIDAEKTFSQFSGGLWMPSLTAEIDGVIVNFFDGADPEPKSSWDEFYKENKPLYVTRKMGSGYIVYQFGKRHYDAV